jgi:hypothetical protein
VTLRRPRPLTALLAVVLAGLAWWATSLAPFTALAYLPVLVPVLLLAAAVCPRRPADELASPETPAARSALGWLGLGLAAVGLEAVALLAGGRSRAFPSLSTVLDQLLRWHGSRWVVFIIWLLAGFLPAVNRLRAGTGHVRERS